MARAFDRLAASIYLQEAWELINSLLIRLREIEEARPRWLSAQDAAAEQARAARARFDVAAFDINLLASRREQGNIYDAIEAFLASWARLSLLFWPVPRGKGPLRAFTAERGRTLRSLLGLDAQSILADRRLRDAWMHIDERFDMAWLGEALGNRQQFVRSRDVAVAIQHTVRVIDVEALTVYFHDANGQVCSQQLQPLGPALIRLLDDREVALRTRVFELPEHEPHNVGSSRAGRRA